MREWRRSRASYSGQSETINGPWLCGSVQSWRRYLIVVLVIRVLLLSACLQRQTERHFKNSERGTPKYILHRIAIDKPSSSGWTIQIHKTPFEKHSLDSVYSFSLLTQFNSLVIQKPKFSIISTTLSINDRISACIASQLWHVNFGTWPLSKNSSSSFNRGDVWVGRHPKSYILFR